MRKNYLSVTKKHTKLYLETQFPGGLTVLEEAALIQTFIHHTGLVLSPQPRHTSKNVPLERAPQKSGKVLQNAVLLAERSGPLMTLIITLTSEHIKAGFPLQLYSSVT